MFTREKSGRPLAILSSTFSTNFPLITLIGTFPNYLTRKNIERENFSKTSPLALSLVKDNQTR